MYENFFGLKSLPFENTPSPEFFFSGGQYRPALASLLYGLKSGKGLLAVAGPSGCGKTTLSHAILKHLPENVKMISVINLPARPFDLLKLIALELDIADPGDSGLLLAKKIKDGLLASYNGPQSVVIVLDEAQSLTQSQLDEILLLSNMETSDAKLCRILLLGRDELADLLNRPEHIALRQRTAMILILKPLDQADTVHYIHFRLRQAGNTGDIFTPHALSLVFSFSRGIPRIINKLCDLSMLKAFLQNRLIVDEELVTDASLELGLDASHHKPISYKKIPTAMADVSVEKYQRTDMDSPSAAPKHNADPYQPPKKIKPRRMWGPITVLFLFLISFSGGLFFWRQPVNQTEPPPNLQKIQIPEAFIQPGAAVPAATDKPMETDYHPIADLPVTEPTISDAPPTGEPAVDDPPIGERPIDEPAITAEPEQKPTPPSYTVRLATVFSKADLDAEMKRFRKKGIVPYWIVTESPYKTPAYQIRTHIFADENELKKVLAEIGADRSQAFKTPQNGG